MVVGVVGATGLVGQTLISVLSDSVLPIELKFLTASSSSIGKIIPFRGKPHSVEETSISTLTQSCDVVFLAVSTEIAKKWRSYLLKHHRWIIDLSSAYRMNSSIPLLVPEVNAEILRQDNGWISNPNCSTIQLVKILFPIHQQWGLQKVIVSTYQSVSGMGHAGLVRLNQEEKGQFAQKVAPLHRNVIPWIGEFSDENISEEETKMIGETRKILQIPDLPIYPTAVRVPVPISHSESIYIETNQPFDLDSTKKLWRKKPGLQVSEIPIQPKDVVGSNQVYISRIRSFSSNTLLCWGVADNIRVGSAWNAFQILELLAERGLVS